MLISPIHTRLFKQGDDLAAFVVEHIPTLSEKSVVVVTSKIVALAEGRTVDIASKADRAAWVQKESELAIRTHYTWMTLRDGMAMSSAGVDESNGNGKLILLPKDCFASAQALWSALRKTYGVNELGVIITDSRTLPLRKGSVGVCMGFAGMQPLKDYIGTPDLFGRQLHVSVANVVDALSAAAVHTMGESDQSQPLALITGADVQFSEKPAERAEIQIPPREDLYVPFYEAIAKTYGAPKGDAWHPSMDVKHSSGTMSDAGDDEKASSTH